MKKYTLFFVVLCAFLLSNCYKEDPVHAELESYRRTYDTLSSDPVFKYVSQYYYKFEKLLIMDPDTADYLFNFISKSPVKIVKPKQEQQHLIKCLDFFKDIFLNGYSDEVIHQLFPYRLLVCDSVLRKDINNGGKWTSKDYHFEQYQVAFRIDDKVMSMSENEKATYSSTLNLNFLLEYCAKYGGGFKIPNEFYTISKEFRGRYKGAQLPKEEWYERGFLTISGVGHYQPFWSDDPADGYDYTDFPSMDDTDFSYFFKGMVSLPYDELQEIIATYPKVKARLVLIDKELKKMGIDYRNMGYKAKVD